MPYLLRKLLRLILVLLLVAAATFLLLNLLQGDVALALLGNEATPQAIAQVRAELGLDQPLILRYLHWLFAFMQGDLGRSYITQVPILESTHRSASGDDRADAAEPGICARCLRCRPGCGAPTMPAAGSTG